MSEMMFLLALALILWLVERERGKTEERLRVVWHNVVQIANFVSPPSSPPCRCDGVVAGSIGSDGEAPRGKQQQERQLWRCTAPVKFTDECARADGRITDSTEPHGEEWCHCIFTPLHVTIIDGERNEEEEKP